MVPEPPRVRPLGHHGLPQEIAGPFVCVANDEAAYFTGSVITMDGGETAGSLVSGGGPRGWWRQLSPPRQDAPGCRTASRVPVPSGKGESILVPTGGDRMVPPFEPISERTAPASSPVRPPSRSDSSG